MNKSEYFYFTEKGAKHVRNTVHRNMPVKFYWVAEQIAEALAAHPEGLAGVDVVKAIRANGYTVDPSSVQKRLRKMRRFGLVDVETKLEPCQNNTGWLKRYLNKLHVGSKPGKIWSGKLIGKRAMSQATKTKKSAAKSKSKANGAHEDPNIAGRFADVLRIMDETGGLLNEIREDLSAARAELSKLARETDIDSLSDEARRWREIRSLLNQPDVGGKS